MMFTQSVESLIRARVSCRNYRVESIPADRLEVLNRAAAALPAGPFGGTSRFLLATAAPEDQDALRGLGTYGFIRNPAGFIIGAANPEGKGLEDFGYQMEILVLTATDLGVGTCWLGGSFNRSGFSQKIGLRAGESIPTVTAIGLVKETQGLTNQLIRRSAGSDRRLPWNQLFFEGKFGAPLAADACGVYALPLEMVRLGPSASNKQPWRVVRQGESWHFYMQRTPGYRGGVFTRMLGVQDMQRVDMGIALCHFELTAREAGLIGRWDVSNPGIPLPDEATEYTATWRAG